MVLVIFVVVAAGAAGAIVQAQLAPYVAPSSHLPTSLSVHISGFRWEFSGCGEGNRSLSGGFYPAGENLTLSTAVAVPASSSPCTVSSAVVTPTAFSLVRANVPLVVPAGSSATVTVVVAVPAFLEPEEITISVAGASS